MTSTLGKVTVWCTPAPYRRSRARDARSGPGAGRVAATAAMVSRGRDIEGGDVVGERDPVEARVDLERVGLVVPVETVEPPPDRLG